MSGRFSPLCLALAYVVFSVLALALFAAPLWHAWRVNVGTLRVFVPEDMQGLPDLFHREGADAVAAAVRSRSDPTGREVIVFAGPRREVLAGTLRRWPAEIPDAPGTYGHVIDRGDGSMMRIVVSRVSMPGDYHLLMGRQSAGLMSLEGYFWYGMGAAMVIVLALGGALAWHLARRANAARRSEERYGRALQASNDGIWEWNPATDEIFLSGRARRLWAVPDGVSIRTRADLKRLGGFHPDDLQRTEDAIKASRVPGAGSFELEYRVVALSGEARWVRSQGRAFPGAAGRPTLVTGSLTDITERKLAEDALRKSEERYSLAVEASEEGHFDVEYDTNEHFYSDRLYEMVGIAPGTRFANRAEALKEMRFYGSDAEIYLGGIRAVEARNGPDRYEFEFRIVRPSGEMRWLRTRGKVTRDAEGNIRRRTGMAADITEAKLAEQALRESQERYALAVAGSDDGVWDVDFAARRVFLSARARELTGLPAGPEMVPFDEFQAMLPLHPDDVPRRLAAMQAHLTGKAPAYEGEFRLRQLDGVYRWRRIHGICVRDANGQPQRMAGSFSDVDARRRAEDALRASEERYSLAMEASEEGYVDVDIDTDEFVTSERLNEIFGIARGTRFANRADFLSKFRFYGTDAEIYSAAMRSVMAKDGPNRYEFEFRIVRPSGEVRWLWTRGQVTRDAEGRARRRVGVVADVTARRQAVETLRESESRFRALTELSSDAYWVQDENLRFLPTGAKVDLAGYASDLHVGKTRWELSSATPLSGTWAEHEAVLQARKPFRDFEYRRPGPDGSVRYLSVSGAPIFDDQGRFCGYQGVGRDITGRKRTEEEVRESEARFRSLVELSSDWYWKQDQNLRFIGYVPPDVGSRSGVAAASSLGKTRWEFDDVTPLSGTWEDHQAVLAARQPFRDFEYLRLDENGVPHYTVISGVPLFDAEGRFVGYHGVGRNISERRRMEENLRQSESRFRALTELSSDWYWQQDEHLRFTYVSHQGLDATGLPGDTVIGRTRWDFDHVKPLSGSWAEHQALLAAQQPFRDFELMANAPDGTVNYLSISGAPIFDAQGCFRGYQGVARNITERKRIEEELRSRQEMLELAQKSAGAVAFEWRIGADGLYRNRSSPELAAMYGVRPEALDGSFDQWKKLIHAEDWPAVKRALKHALRTGDVATEYRVIHPSGAVHWLHAKGRMFFDAAGKPTRMLGFMQDVTQRRQAEEEYRRMERQLRQAQRLEAMGTLAGGIAHDFNNILGAILGYGEMALREAPKGNRLRRDLDSIIVAGERGRALVDRVLAFSRSGVADRVPVHVEKVVREALDLVSAKLPPDVTLHAKLHAGSAAVLGDPTQVHQVLMNLATNAIQAMPGGGTLRVHLDAQRIDTVRVAAIGTLSAADYLVLKVADTGAGIAPEIMERIFDPFFTTKEVGTGTGLGLSLVHGIVSDLGGAIDVASAIGAGSAFTVYLPRSGDAVDDSHEEELEMPRGDGQRVLVVDDEEPLVLLATRTLEELGYAPVGFTSSTAALAAFRADPKRFDAVITDERMPGLSGSALIREVRGIRVGIPIVLMSGYVGAAIARRAREAGAEEVLKKPISARDLAASLARVLHQ
jgi:PAS domain S-box-containing protein